MSELAAKNADRSLPRAAPADFEKAQFFDGIHWHQKWQIFDGIFTPGRNPVSELLDYARVPRDLTGKTVLDVGAWNGGFSFECARRGASRVVGFGPDDPDMTGFNKIKTALELQNVDYVHGSIYDVRALGRFDVVLLFGVIYHLRHPLLALDNLYDIVDDTLYVESFVCDDHVVLGPDRAEMGMEELDPRLTSSPIWQFYQRDELYGDTSNWFGPNLCALKAAVESSGFEVFHDQRWSTRAALAAKKVAREFSRLNAYENLPVVADSVNALSRSSDGGGRAE